MFIRSERLFLRPGWPEDWQEIPGLISDRQIITHLFSTAASELSAEARALAGQPQDQRYPHFLVTVPGAQGTRIAGVCGIAPQAGDVPELGFWIAPGDCGNGYATEAARAVLRLARTLGHRQVAASHFVDDLATARVLRKLGFRPTGELRPRYDMLSGKTAPAILYTCELGAPGDCDNSGGDMPSGDTDGKVQRAA